MSTQVTEPTAAQTQNPAAVSPAPETKTAPVAPEAKAPVVNAEPAKVEGAANQPQANAPEAAKPVVPEKYEFKLPEGSLLDASRLDQLSAISKEKGWSQETAQAVLERESDAVSSFVKGIQENHEKTSRVQWVEEVKNDPEMGGADHNVKMDMATNTLKKLLPAEDLNILKESGFGNHPILVRLAYRVAKASQPDSFVHPGAQPGPQLSAEERWYPSTKKE